MAKSAVWLFMAAFDGAFPHFSAIAESMVDLAFKDNPITQFFVKLFVMHTTYLPSVISIKSV